MANGKLSQVVQAVLDMILNPAFFERPRSCGPIAVVVRVEIQRLSHEIDTVELVESFHEYRIPRMLE